MTVNGKDKRGVGVEEEEPTTQVEGGGVSPSAAGVHSCMSRLN